MLVLATFVFLTDRSHGQLDVFVPTELARPEVLPPVVRAQAVEFTNDFYSMNVGETYRFNAFRDAEMDFVITLRVNSEESDSVAPYFRAEGHVVGHEGASKVRFIYRNGVVHGKALAPTLGIYQVVSMRTGAPIVSDYDLGALSVGECSLVESTRVDDPQSGEPELVIPHPKEVKILVAATSLTSSIYYNEVEDAFSDLVDALDQSNASFRIVLDRLSCPDYQEPGTTQEVWDDLTMFGGSHAGLDHLLVYRNQVQADIVVFLTETAVGNPMASQMVHPNPDDAFVVMERSALLDVPYQFAHMIGHVFGCGHLVGTDRGRFAFSHGWKLGDYETIMAGHGPQPISAMGRIGNFSNPSVMFPAANLPTGAANLADNAKTLRDSEPAVRDYRRAGPITNFELIDTDPVIRARPGEQISVKLRARTPDRQTYPAQDSPAVVWLVDLDEFRIVSATSYGVLAINQGIWRPGETALNRIVSDSSNGSLRISGDFDDILEFAGPLRGVGGVGPGPLGGGKVDRFELTFHAMDNRYDNGGVEIPSQRLTIDVDHPLTGYLRYPATSVNYLPDGEEFTADLILEEDERCDLDWAVTVVGLLPDGTMVPSSLQAAGLVASLARDPSLSLDRIRIEGTPAFGDFFGFSLGVTVFEECEEPFDTFAIGFQILKETLSPSAFSLLHGLGLEPVNLSPDGQAFSGRIDSTHPPEDPRLLSWAVSVSGTPSPPTTNSTVPLTLDATGLSLVPAGDNHGIADLKGTVQFGDFVRYDFLVTATRADASPFKPVEYANLAFSIEPGDPGGVAPPLTANSLDIDGDALPDPAEFSLTPGEPFFVEVVSNHPAGDPRLLEWSETIGGVPPDGSPVPPAALTLAELGLTRTLELGGRVAKYEGTPDFGPYEEVLIQVTVARDDEQASVVWTLLQAP